jgi:hypothetical protein
MAQPPRAAGEPRVQRAPRAAGEPSAPRTPRAPREPSAPRTPRPPRAARTAITGHGFRDLIAGYIHHQYAEYGLVVYREVNLGKTIIAKDRQIDVFVMRPADQKAVAIECKYQDVQGTADEKIPYALDDLAALWVPGCLVYAGRGWSKGVLHQLEASRLAAYCLPERPQLSRTRATRELDYILAATFGFWEQILPAAKRYRR